MKLRNMNAIFNKLNVVEKKCKHHVRGYVMHDGKALFPVYYSFGRKEIPVVVVEKIARSMKLKKAELIKMGKCEIGKDEYYKMLENRGVL